MTPSTIQIPIPVTVLFKAVKSLSPADKKILKQLLDQEEAKPETSAASYRYPLRELPITIAEDFDEPMPELWSALVE